MSTPYLSIWSGSQVDEGITRAYVVKEQLDRRYEGTWDLASSVDSGSVSGLDLPFIPTSGQLTLEVPAAGVVLSAVFVRGSFSSDGFDFKLSDLTDDTDYRLHYLLVGDGEGESSS